MIRETIDNVTCFTPLIAEAIRVEVISFMVDGELDCVIFGYRRIECVDIKPRRWVEEKETMKPRG